MKPDRTIVMKRQPVALSPAYPDCCGVTIDLRKMTPEAIKRIEKVMAECGWQKGANEIHPVRS